MIIVFWLCFKSLHPLGRHPEIFTDEMLWCLGGGRSGVVEARLFLRRYYLKQDDGNMGFHYRILSGFVYVHRFPQQKVTKECPCVCVCACTHTYTHTHPIDLYMHNVSLERAARNLWWLSVGGARHWVVMSRRVGFFFFSKFIRIFPIWDTRNVFSIQKII